MSMAIKHAMNKRRRMAEGGQVHETLDYTEMKPGERKGQSRAGVEVREAARQRGYGDADSMARAKRAEGRAKEEHRAVLHDQKKMKKPHLYAEGGQVLGKIFSGMASGGGSSSGGTKGQSTDKADSSDNFEHPSTSTPVTGSYAKGGECHACKGGTCMEHGGLVDRVMRKRMSKGGMVANDTEPEADSESADFDYLAEHDDLAFHDTGANSGDRDGGRDDDEGRDIVSRAMRSRKKERLPRPA